MKGTYNVPAPGTLETVRHLMNTWVVPTATRVPEDKLPALVRDQEAWTREFPDLPLGAGDTVELLVELRDDLRRMLDGGGWRATFNRWLERLPPLVEVVASA